MTTRKDDGLQWINHEEPTANQYFSLGEMHYVQVGIYKGAICSHIKRYYKESWGLRAEFGSGVFLDEQETLNLLDALETIEKQIPKRGGPPRKILLLPNEPKNYLLVVSPAVGGRYLHIRGYFFLGTKIGRAGDVCYPTYENFAPARQSKNSRKWGHSDPTNGR